MNPIGLYRPGTSWLHRAPAGWKLGVLTVCGVLLFLVRSPVVVGVAAAVVLLGYATARVPWRVAGALLRPLLWLAVPLAGFHWWFNGWRTAVVVVGVIVVLVMLANLVTVTTRSTDLVDVVVRVVGPLRRVGVDPERVGLLMLLGIRSVPVVFALAARVRDAQRARGLGTSVRAFAVPLLVGALRHADALGDALAARGVDD